MRQSLNEIKNVIDKHEYTICCQAGANNIKEDGYILSEIITLIVMFQLMLLKTANAFYKS